MQKRFIINANLSGGAAVMKIRSLIRYSSELLRGRGMRAVLVSLMPVSAELIFRLAEAASYSLLLYFGDISPLGLFTGESTIQLLASAACTVLRWLTLAPLLYASAYWFESLSGERGEKSLTALILDSKIYKRSLAALLWTKFIGVLLLVPVFLFASAAYWLVSAGSGGISVLMAVHAAVMTAVSVFLWLRAKLAMLMLPFFMVNFPDKKALSAVRHTFRIMRGRRSGLFRLLAVYIPPMLTVIFIPVMLPKLVSAMAVFADISVKEDEYLEGNKVEGRIGQATDAAKLSDRKKRRVKAASDKAQAAGYGNNP